jgi:hypothetical protein
VNSFLTEQFLVLYRQLPESVRQQARQAYQLFQNDPHHPGLRFKKVHPRRPVYSARVGIDYRVIGVRDGNDIHWFWIGAHSDYDHVLKQL